MGTANQAPLPTSEKSDLPINGRHRRADDDGQRMDRREIMALPSLLSASTMTSDRPASPMFAHAAVVGRLRIAAHGPLGCHRHHDRPMMVITQPLTSAGKTG